MNVWKQKITLLNLRKKETYMCTHTQNENEKENKASNNKIV